MNRPLIFLGYLTLISLMFLSYFSINPERGWTTNPPSQSKGNALPYHYAFHDCAPWDGPTIHLAFKKFATPDSQTPPLLSVSFWPSNPPLHQWIPVGDSASSNDNGYASWCPKKNGCEPVEGELRFETFSATHLKGTFRLRTAKTGIPNTPIDFDMDFTIPKQQVLCG